MHVRWLHRLDTRLLVWFGSLAALILVAMSATLFGFLRVNAIQQVEASLEATGEVQDRLWEINERQLVQTAETLGADFGFREAVATEDIATIASALVNLKDRVQIARAFVVLTDGRGIEAGTTRQLATPDLILNAIEAEGNRAGVLFVGDDPFHAVSVPINAPRLVGWLILADDLGPAAMREIEALAALPIKVSLARDAGDMSRDIVSVRDLTGFTGTESESLTLHYPLSAALAPYQPTFTATFLVGLVALLVFALFCSIISRSITTPVRTLDRAVRDLADGKPLTLAVTSRDEVGRLSANFMDMARRIEQREAHITRLSLSDTETDLPNRRALDTAIERRLAESGPGNTFVIAVGLERLEQIRTVIGFEHTNAVLVRVAEYIASSRNVILCARLASDVIGVLALAKDRDEIISLFDPANTRGTGPVQIGSERVDVRVVVGICDLKENNGLEPIDCASCALEQMRAQRQAIGFFDSAKYGDPRGSLALMSDLTGSMVSGDVWLAYQPKLDLRTGQIYAAEALMRWQHPVHGFVSPDRFITLAEETGFVRPLTEWVVEQALRDRVALSDSGHDLKIAINLSSRLLTETSAIDALLGLIGTEGRHFCFEITETAVMDDPVSARANILRLRKAGLTISIDDYGTGLSSLTYLRQIPADELKIDKSFIMQMQSGSSDALLVKSTIDLAHSLGLKVVAEGVETETVQGLLATMGADFAQGYHISRPVRCADLITFLEALTMTSGEIGQAATALKHVTPLSARRSSL